MVKQGYQQTEIGMIPKDWNVRKLSECTKRVGVGLATSVTQHYQEDGVPIFRNLNIKPGYLDDSDILFLDPEFANRQESKRIRTGDVLTVHTGYVGISCVVPAKYDNALTFTTLITTTEDRLLLPEFLSVYLNSSFGALEIESLQAGGGRNNLNVNDFINFRIPLPSITEQKCIAEALSDVDSMISSLEKLIAKKKAIKQGAMQELLTGKKRLPGFVGEWKEKKIEDIAEVGRGRVISHNEISKNIGGKYPVYSSQTINNGVMGYLRTFDFDGDYITWTTDGVNAGTVFYRSGKFNCTNVCGTIKCKRDNPSFVSRRLGVETPSYVATNLANPKLMNDVMKKITITLPPTFEEQTAIASVLSDMDNEIEALEQKLAKARRVKQGMMQQLLTGKIRLV